MSVPRGRAVMKRLSLPAQAGSLWCCGCSGPGAGGMREPKPLLVSLTPCPKYAWCGIVWGC